MQSVSGAFSQLSGAPDVDTRTATGIAIMREQAVSMLTPALSLKAECDAEWARQVLSLAQKYYMGERYLPAMGRFGQAEGRWFDRSDIRGDFRIEPEPNSWMPRTELEMRNDLLSFITAGGLPGGFLHPAFNDYEEVRDRACELFRVPFNIDSRQAPRRVAQLRLDKMKEAVKFYQSEGVVSGGEIDQGMVEAITSVAPLMPEVDNAPVMIKFYQDWLLASTDSDGLDADPLLQQAVLLRIIQHKEEAVRAAQEKSAAALMARAPEMAAHESSQAEQAEYLQGLKQQGMMQAGGSEGGPGTSPQEMGQNRRDAS